MTQNKYTYQKKVSRRNPDFVSMPLLLLKPPTGAFTLKNLLSKTQLDSHWDLC